MAGRAESNRAAEEAFTSAVLGERSDSVWSNVHMFMDTKQTDESKCSSLERNSTLWALQHPHVLRRMPSSAASRLCASQTVVVLFA